MVGINGTKEAIEAIKAGKMLASGDYNGILQGCLSTMTVVRELRKLPVEKDVVFPATVIAKDNLSAYESPVESRGCPKWEEAIAKKFPPAHDLPRRWPCALLPPFPGALP